MQGGGGIDTGQGGWAGVLDGDEPNAARRRLSQPGGNQVDASQGGRGSRYRGCIGDEPNAARRRLSPSGAAAEGDADQHLSPGGVVPASHADRSQQLRVDEGPDDLQSQAGALLQGEARR